MVNVEAFQKSLADGSSGPGCHKTVGDDDPGEALWFEDLGHAKNESVVEVNATSETKLLRQKLRRGSTHDLGAYVGRIGNNQIVSLGD